MTETADTGPDEAPPPRRFTGPRRSPDVHGAILEAAIRLVAEQGYAAASIEAIARRAGAGKQTVYRWWPSRSALLAEAYRRLVPPERLLGVPSDDPAADIEVAIGRLLRIYQRTPAGRILIGLAASASSDEAADAALRSGIMFGDDRALALPLRTAVADGVLPPDFDVGAAVETAVALIWHRLLSAPEALDGAFARSVARRIMTVGGKR
jgi:AcrR family transcriptional regulator